jgi:hypothetical protein
MCMYADNMQRGSRQLDHHVRNLHILLGLILGRDLKNDILLVWRNGFLANCLHEFAEPRKQRKKS